MPALVEAHTHPDWPGITTYEITANRPDDVQTAITAIMNTVEENGGAAAFDHPHKGYSIKDGMKLWRSTGRVMSAS